MCLNVFIKTTNHSVILVYISVYSSLKIYLVNLTVKIYSIFIKLWKNSYVFINSYCFILKLLFGQLVLPLAQSWSSRRNRNSQCVRMIETYIRKASGTWLIKIPLLLFWISNHSTDTAALKWVDAVQHRYICLMFINKTSYHEWTTIFPFIRCH